MSTSSPPRPPGVGPPGMGPTDPARRHRGREILLWLLAALAVAAAVVIFVVQPFQSTGPPTEARSTATATGSSTTTSSATTSTPTASTPSTSIPSASSPTASSTTASKPAASVTPTPAATTTSAGVIPTRLVIPDLQVDAAVVQVGLDEYGNLGAPSHDDRTKAGWYAMGPRPGGGRGNVLMDGHTFVNDSAIFKSDFAEKIHVGMAISVFGADGVAHRYTATTVLPAVNKKDEYPGVVAQYKLYDFTGPERLVIVTCSGSFNWITKNHEDVSIVIADVAR